MAGKMSNFERISCFGGHVCILAVKNDIEKNKPTIDVKSYKFSSRTNSFSVTNHQTSFIAHSFREAALEACLDKCIGLYKLSILVTSFLDFTIFNIDAVFKLKTVAKYELSHISDDLKIVQKFFLFDSKGVCFRHGPDRIVVLYDGSVRSYQTEVQFSVLDCRTVEGFLVIIGKTTKNEASILILYTSLSSHNRLVKCSSQLIPDFYASILTCLRIVNLDVIDAVSPNLQFNGSVLACTSYGQLVECRSGQLSDCVPLPFCDGCDIRCVNPSSDPFDRSLVVVLSATGSSCVVDLKTSQVVFVLEDVESVLVDDFVGRGADQILFLPCEARHQSNIDVVSMVDESSDRDINSGFLLTDLAGIHVDKWTSSQNCDKLSKSNSTASHQAAVDALQSRLLAGREMVSEARRSCLRKLTVIEETSEAVRKMMLGETLVTRSKNILVPLTGNQMIGNQPCGSPVSKVDEAENVTTGDLWQRIVDRKLVIGLQVHNATKSKIHSVQLLLFNGASTAEELRSTSRCLCIRPSPFSVAHPTKRPKNETDDFNRYIVTTIIEEVEAIPSKGNANVLACCNLPLFHPKESQTLSVILAWKKVEGSGSDQRMIHLSRPVGGVSFDVENVIRGTWNASFGADCGEMTSGDIEKEAVVMATQSADLLALHCIQMGLRLRMSSAKSVFPRLFLTSLESSQLGFAYVNRHVCFICTPHDHPLFLTRLRILRIRYDDLVVEMFVRDTTQWTILLQSLFKLLPNDVTVAMDTTCGVAPLAESVVLAMRQELLITDHREPVSPLADNRETDEWGSDVAGVRNRFESRRRRFADRTLMGADESCDEGYPMKNLELKENTDRLMMSLAEVTGNR